MTSIFELEQLFCQRRSDAETRSRVLPIGDDEIDGVVADNAGQAVFDDGASGPPENVADEENPHIKEVSHRRPAGISQSFVKIDGNTRKSGRPLIDRSQCASSAVRRKS